MAKKLGAIISLSIIGVLILTTVIMANIDVSYALSYPTPDKIWIQYSSKTTRLLDDSKHNEVKNFIDAGSKEASLTALFNGTLNDEPVLVNNSTNGTSIPSTSGYYITFLYNNPQKLENFKDENGKDYYYRALVFTVSNVDELAEIKVYVLPYYTTDGETVQNDQTLYTKYYKVKANYSALYEYLTNNGFNK